MDWPKRSGVGCILQLLRRVVDGRAGGADRFAGLAVGTGWAKVERNPADASALRVRIAGADRGGFWVHWRFKRGTGDKPPTSTWVLEALAVAVVAMTGHLGGFLSGVNHPYHNTGRFFLELP